MHTKCGRMQPTRATFQPAAIHGKNSDLAGWPWLQGLWRQWYSRPSMEALGLQVIFPNLWEARTPSGCSVPALEHRIRYQLQNVPSSKHSFACNRTTSSPWSSGGKLSLTNYPRNTLKQEGCQFIDEQTGKNANTKSNLGMDKQHSHTLMGSV